MYTRLRTWTERDSWCQQRPYSVRCRPCKQNVPELACAPDTTGGPEPTQTLRQAERQRYRHGQIALTHWRAIDELDASLTLKPCAPSRRAAEDFLACVAAYRTDVAQLATDSATVLRDDAVVAVFDPCRKKA